MCRLLMSRLLSSFWLDLLVIRINGVIILIELVFIAMWLNFRVIVTHGVMLKRRLICLSGL